MKNEFTVFYSWQSDTKKNRNFIDKCLKKAIKAVKTKHKTEFNIEINLDRDTMHESGSPNISETILNKIDNSDIFIADVSIINKTWLNKLKKDRLTPNPNVLFELGYAVNAISWERVVCVNNLEFGLNEELPFDIRGHRISSYNKNIEESKAILTGHLKNAILAIIENFEDIEDRRNKSLEKRHDKEIWKLLDDICSEDSLKDGISTAVNSFFSNKYYYDKWDRFIEFYKKSSNYFIDKEIHVLMNEMLNKLDEFRTICSINFFLSENSRGAFSEFIAYVDSSNEINEDVRIDFLQNIEYQVVKTPLSGEDWPGRDKRLDELQEKLLIKGEETKNSYSELTMILKKKQILIL